MRCTHCNEMLPEGSVFCPYCGHRLEITTKAEPDVTSTNEISERDRITSGQHYFDEDYGYSEDNPLVVSSVPEIGYYLFAFRTKEGQSFTWKRESFIGAPEIDKYSLFLNGELYKTVFFNHAGNNTNYLPRGIYLDEGAYDAAKRGLSVEEYAAELEAKRIKQEEERLELEQRKRQEQEEQERQTRIAKENEERQAAERAEKERKQKVQRKRLAVAAAICVVAGIATCFGIFAYKGISYNRAVKAMESGEYESAITVFTKYSDYKDAQAKLLETYYLFADFLYDDGKYEEAKEYYVLATDYKNPAEKIDACDYQIGLIQLEAGEYEAAIEIFGRLSSTDAKERLAHAYYKAALKAYLDHDYPKAYRYCNAYQYHPLDGYDLSFVTALKKDYARELIATGTLANCRYATKVLESFGNTDDEVSELIAEAKKCIQKVRYDSAKEKLNQKKHREAITEFAQILDYSDAKECRLKAMYEYVQSNRYKYYHYYSSSEKFNLYEYATFKKEQEEYYGYAKELADGNYEDSKSFYKDLTAWKVSIVMNNSENNHTDALTRISKYDMAYAHIEVLGGPYDGEIKLRYVFTMSDGGTVKGSWNYPFNEGDTTWCSCYYEQPQYAPTGTCKVKIYEIGSGKLLAEDKIRITG